MKTFFIVILFLSVNISIAFSQNFLEETPSKDSEKIPLRERFFLAGGIGLQFGTFTNIEISPMLGYKITEDWKAGAGLSYQYISVNNSQYYVPFSTSIYGPRAFSNYLITSKIFAHVEWEALSLESKYFDYLNKYPSLERFWVSSFLVGGGYRIMVGDRSSVNIMLLFNLNETVYSPYSNPIYRVSFYF